MKRLRLFIAIIVFWLFLLYNIERLSRPVNLSSLAYVFILIAATVTICIPQLHRVTLWLTLGGQIVLFLSLKAWLGYRLWGTATPLTVTELSFITLTSLLARQVNHALGEFEDVVTNITIETVGKSSEPFAASQGEMYREVRRARTYQRPLSLMAVGLGDGMLQDTLPRLVTEAQQAMSKHLALSKIARVLNEELEDYHIIAKQNNHFIVLLPETTEENLAMLERQLCESASTKLGFRLKIGTSSLSEDIITFERLVEEATSTLETLQKRSPSPEPLGVHHRTPS
jgi:hypothetical protein